MIAVIGFKCTARVFEAARKDLAGGQTFSLVLRERPSPAILQEDVAVLMEVHRMRTEGSRPTGREIESKVLGVQSSFGGQTLVTLAGLEDVGPGAGAYAFQDEVAT